MQSTTSRAPRRERTATPVNLWVWRIEIARQGPRDAALRAVLQALATHLKPDGTGWATQAQIAQGAAMSDRTIRSKLDQASKAGWLGMAPRGLSGRQWKSYEFRACVPQGHRFSNEDFEARAEELLTKHGPVEGAWLLGSHFTKRPEPASGHGEGERPHDRNLTTVKTGISRQRDRNLTTERPEGGSDTFSHSSSRAFSKELVEKRSPTRTPEELRCAVRKVRAEIPDIGLNDLAKLLHATAAEIEALDIPMDYAAEAAEEKSA